MRYISIWASRNPAASRLLIVILRLLSCLLAWMLGKQLLPESTFSAGSVWLFLLLFVITFIVYPSARKRRSRSYISSYRFRKAADFALCVFSFCMLTALFNQSDSTVFFSTKAGGGTSVVHPEKNGPDACSIIGSLPYRDKKSLSRSEKRILKTEFKKQLGVYGKAVLRGDKKASADALTVILVLIGAVGLFYAVTILACTVACSGADGAAIAILILGTAGIIAGATAIIRASSRKNKQRKAEPLQTPG